MSILKRLTSMPGIPLLVVLAIVFGLLSGVAGPNGRVTTGAGERVGSSPTGSASQGSAAETAAANVSATGGAGTVGGARAKAGGMPAPGSTGAGEKLGQGVVADRIKIGYLVPDRDWDALFTALGTPSGGRSFGDQRAMVEAVVKDVNATGGMAGRRVDPYYFVVSINRSLSPGGGAAQDREACTYWTQDNKVFAVMQVGFESWPIMNCLTENKVLHINTSTYVSASHYQKIADYYRNMNFNSLDRQARDYIYGLQRQGFFDARTGWGPTSKIGLLHVDQSVAPDFPEAVKSLEVELAKYGLKVGERAAVAITSNWANLVVQFRNAGVTHVIFFVSSPLHYSLFMQAAQEQLYNPWYGISSAAAPGILLQYTAPAEQLVKSIGPGWEPLGDVAPADNPYALSAADRRCLEVMARAGLDSSDPLQRGLQIATCRMNWFYQEGLNKSRPNLTVQGVASAISSGGNSYFAMAGLPMAYRYGPDRVNDGAAHFRPLFFDGGCDCYKYEGDIQPMP